MRPLSRRDFIKVSGGTLAGILVSQHFGFEQVLAASPKGITFKKLVGEKTSICAFCAGGCGILVSSQNNNLIAIEGNTDHPINRGSLCSKAQSLYQMRTVDGKLNPRRLTKVLYRAPNSSTWEKKSWDWAFDEIAKRIKSTRDQNWQEKDQSGTVVNRTEAIAHFGGAAHDNEECYLLSKMNRALGVVYLEHQARI
jgi:formate dehydrogenase major subunit